MSRLLLFRAAQRNDLEAVKKLLEQQQTQCTRVNLQRVFRVSIYNDCESVVRHLQAMYPFDLTIALGCAARNGSGCVIRMLDEVRNLHNSNTPFKIGLNHPMQGACCYGQQDIVQYLLRAKASQSPAPGYTPRYTPMYFAVVSGNARIVRCLLRNNASLHESVGAYNETPLECARRISEQSAKHKCVARLLERCWERSFL
jgi:hypothetical protein